MKNNKKVLIGSTLFIMSMIATLTIVDFTSDHGQTLASDFPAIESASDFPAIESASVVNSLFLG